MKCEIHLKPESRKDPTGGDVTPLRAALTLLKPETAREKLR